MDDVEEKMKEGAENVKEWKHTFSISVYSKGERKPNEEEARACLLELLLQYDEEGEESEQLDFFDFKGTEELEVPEEDDDVDWSPEFDIEPVDSG